MVLFFRKHVPVSNTVNTFRDKNKTGLSPVPKKAEKTGAFALVETLHLRFIENRLEIHPPKERMRIHKECWLRLWVYLLAKTLNMFSEAMESLHCCFTIKSFSEGCSRDAGWSLRNAERISEREILLLLLSFSFLHSLQMSKEKSLGHGLGFLKFHKHHAAA